MTNLHRALGDIRDIRRQVAYTTEFRGYGPLALSATAVLAAAAGVAQAYWVPDPSRQAVQYVALWLATAVVSASLIATQMLRRANRLHRGLADEMIRIAVTQFLPAGLAGAVLPFALLHAGREIFWLLPGLWQIVFSLGIFACCRSLPRLMVLAGGWFLLTGFTCLWLGDAHALAPMTMSGAYGVGMTLVTGIHHFSAKEASLNEDDAL